ncbi:MAG: hypothetical protein CMJ65_17325 [Planctomycetaceae bacterium]|jgi:hypothetical protein|nr:hypothetical protein [Planctomycetaceae bacterium]
MEVYDQGVGSLGTRQAFAMAGNDFVDPTSVTLGTVIGRPRVHPSLTARLTQPERVVPTLKLRVQTKPSPDF